MKNELTDDVFEAWWLSLAHVQLGYSDESHKSIARAVWQAAARHKDAEIEQLKGKLWGAEDQVRYLQKYQTGQSAEIAALRKVLQDLLDCPFSIDRATVAACGLEETMRLNPYQVVAEMSVSLVKIRNAHAAIAQAVQPTTKENHD